MQVSTLKLRSMKQVSARSVERQQHATTTVIIFTSIYILYNLPIFINYLVNIFLALLRKVTITCLPISSVKLLSRVNITDYRYSSTALSLTVDT